MGIFGRKQEAPAAAEPADTGTADSSAWILDNGFAEFALMHTNEIKYMCMLGYTFMHGSKVFAAISDKAPFSYRFINMVMACTGGGIMVPIFINAIPVPLVTDAYPVAILISYMLHTRFPVLREVLALSLVFKAAVMFLYEVMRAFVVVKLTKAAGAAIPASEFDFAVFGPIFCGTVAGCGGAFLPLSKGLDPIKEKGLAPPMFSAFVAATFYHLFMNTSLSEGVVDAQKKAHVTVAAWFFFYSMYVNGIWAKLAGTSSPPVAEKKTNGTAAEAKKTNGTADAEKKTNGTADAEKKTSGTVVEAKKTSGTAVQAKKTSGTAVNAKKTK
eukprot:CAMPEP_0198111420 /NCGR_PEP_ID=MMETSP1442-20131203/3375_1 /TAXON_ID= /ORGANISM="Craspedostauros australis, Strain CCMP3328" /LENGTH=327 /DNA_ID=CAMNT_0043767837 /DNA_START=228 /DNA_END=1211 /DNA_ORIENTATION=+